jgi:CubicO group peptidase (beta-lactamase class C family)
MVSRALIVMGFFWLTTPPSKAASVPSLDAVLQPILDEYHLPGMAAAIFTTDGVTEMGAAGVRKAGSTVNVTKDDLWHWGSDTKMMTALLAGTFVAEGKLSWDAKVISFFPEFDDDAVPAAQRDVTLSQVLRHQAGLMENLNWAELSKTGSLGEQRLAAVRLALTKPAYPPGTFHYSNTDYVIVAAILEKISGKPWEDLMRERVFAPLGMKTAGFGGVGTMGQIDQPWPHAATGVAAPINGPLMDNPAVMAPAGEGHGSMKDWTAFLIDELRGATRLKALLPAAIYRAMQTPGPRSKPDGYGYGWGTCDRSWAGGLALNHSGSNTMNFCVCWLAPGRKFGVAVCTNQGGDLAAKACDDAASALIKRYLAASPPK